MDPYDPLLLKVCCPLPGRVIFNTRILACGYHISLVSRNVVSDCTKTVLVGMRRPARGICAHSEIGEESQCKAGRVSF